tara:strand:+ start:42060 stop:42644 length:585 start_codon:yes stop_codon:yes gene_type:complete
MNDKLVKEKINSFAKAVEEFREEIEKSNTSFFGVKGFKKSKINCLKFWKFVDKNRTKLPYGLVELFCSYKLEIAEHCHGIDDYSFIIRFQDSQENDIMRLPLSMETLTTTSGKHIMDSTCGNVYSWLTQSYLFNPKFWEDFKNGEEKAVIHAVYIASNDMKNFKFITDEIIKWNPKYEDNIKELIEKCENMKSS